MDKYYVLKMKDLERGPLDGGWVFSIQQDNDHLVAPRVTIRELADEYIEKTDFNISGKTIALSYDPPFDLYFEFGVGHKVKKLSDEEKSEFEKRIVELTKKNNPV